MGGGKHRNAFSSTPLPPQVTQTSTAALETLYQGWDGDMVKVKHLLKHLVYFLPCLQPTLKFSPSHSYKQQVLFRSLKK